MPERRVALRCPQHISGGTLASSHVASALSFVMTRASSWLGPVARLHRCGWPAFERTLIWINRWAAVRQYIWFSHRQFNEQITVDG